MSDERKRGQESYSDFMELKHLAVEIEKGLGGYSFEMGRKPCDFVQDTICYCLVKLIQIF